jgi:NAD(P)-dependent dehydrogenase (short-subunit alcohol dehydrogenase family)
MLDGLQGKVIIATGGASGIGRAVGLQAVARGAKVILGDIDEAGLESSCAEIRSMGGQVATFVGDTSSRANAAALVQLAMDNFGRVDGLVCSAMGRVHRPADTITDDEWDFVIDQGLSGYFRCAQEAAGRMFQVGGGSIVFITSVASRVAVPNVVAYSAAKSGIAGLSRQLGVEWIGRGVRVNAIAPGQIINSARPQALGDVPSGDFVTAEQLGSLCIYLICATRVRAGDAIELGGIPDFMPGR